MKPQFFLLLGMMVIAMITVTMNVQSAPGSLEVTGALPAQSSLQGQTSQAAETAASSDEPERVMLPDGWEQLAVGIAYKEYHLPDPNNVYVARLERANPGVIIESSMAQGRLADAMEATSGMAARYDQAINYWGGNWGSRNKVVVAINGAYTDTDNHLPDQGQVHSGWYAKRFDDCETGSGGSGFAWKMDRSAFIGASVKHPEDKQSVTFLKSGKTQFIQGINVSRGSGELILYTPQYDATTNTGDDDSGVEVLVEMRQPNLLSADMVVGIVREIRKNQGSTPIPFDHVVLSASGDARAKLLNNIEEGDEIGISNKIKGYVTDCSSELSPNDWNGTYASIGGAFNFLNDGEIRDFSDDGGAAARHPRTAVVLNDDYVYFVVVDGRDPSISAGMTIAELAVFSRDVLGARWGIAEDGGGSSTMVVNGRVVNNTFCNNVFCQSKIFLPIAMGGEGSGLQEADQPTPLDPAPYPGEQYMVLTPYAERPVPNGLLMVVVEEAAFSDTSRAADATIFSRDDTEVRLGPGRNYAVLASVSADEQGKILDHPLNGVSASGANWWKVELGGVTGWVDGSELGE
jgi:hypothetical protein